MIKLITIITAITFCISTFAQQESRLKISLIERLNEEVTDFTTDNLGNIYLKTTSGQIKKVDDKGDSIAVYNDVKRYGKIYSVDATNPLKILVYYKDFSTIVILDRLLNVRAAIDLRRQNILQVKAVASSYDNNIWVFDEMDSKLKKIDDTGNVLLEFTDFRQIFDSAPSPDVIFDRDGQLYLYDPKKGLLVFDYYGARKNNFQLLSLSDLQVIDKNTITARDSSHVVLYKPATLQLLSFTVFDNQKDFTKINFNGDRVYCLSRTNVLEVYKVIR